MIVELGAGGLGLPDRDYYTKTDDKSVKIREQYVAYIQQLLTLAGESAEQAKADADATLQDRNRAGQGLAHPRPAPRSAQHLPHG